MSADAGTGRHVKSPETIRSQRRQQLPGVEVRTVFDSSRCYWFYSAGFEFFVPSSWCGEILHQRRKQIVQPGLLLAAHPGDVYASLRVLQPGNWHSLTVDARVVAELGGARVAWDQIRLRPFTEPSPHLAGQLDAVMRTLGSAPMDVVVANLRGFLIAVADELIEDAHPQHVRVGVA